MTDVTGVPASEAEVFHPGLMTGQKILVTGGGTGLGKEMAGHFQRLGADVIISGRRSSVLEETAGEIMAGHPKGGRVIPVTCDIRVPDSVEEMVEACFVGGPLTGLVNNAAGNFISRTKDLSHRGFDAIANIVFHGTFYVTHGVGRRWIDGGHRGSVISILTTWIWNGGPFTVPSAMSKAAVNIMTKSLAVEWGPHGIRLNAIAPGPFPTKGAWERLSPGQATDGSESSVSGNPMGRVGQMHELTNLATFLLSPGCDYLTGQTIAIDGGAHLASGGNFSSLAKLDDEDWEEIRSMIKSANDQDRAKRG
ncbi:MAG: SDR family oxidoreductase [Alphaproteobacteria bacterium]